MAFTLVPTGKYKKLQKSVKTLSEKATTTTEWLHTITQEMSSIVEQTKNFTTTEHSNADDALQKLTYRVSQLDVQLRIIDESKRIHCLLVTGEICKKFQTAISWYVMHGWLTEQQLTPDDRKTLYSANSQNTLQLLTLGATI